MPSLSPRRRCEEAVYVIFGGIEADMKITISRRKFITIGNNKDVLPGDPWQVAGEQADRIAAPSFEDSTRRDAMAFTPIVVAATTGRGYTQLFPA
jgi:hypothetical protein